MSFTSRYQYKQTHIGLFNTGVHRWRFLIHFFEIPVLFQQGTFFHDNYFPLPSKKNCHENPLSILHCEVHGII